MAKVWLVCQYRPRGTNDGGEILGVFSTKAKAKAYVEDFFGPKSGDYGVTWLSEGDQSAFFLNDEDGKADVKHDDAYGGVIPATVDQKNPVAIYLG